VRAKLVGGASMFSNLLPAGSIQIGDRNVAAARQALRALGVPIIAEDVGSDHGRSVHFFLDDGRVEVRSLKKGNRVL
jgi:chemotaxis protein CheD